MTVSRDQPHPVDLRWVDELVRSARPHLVLRPEDELLILVPNRPVKVNRTALRILGAMLDEGLGIAEVLAREGDGPRRRTEFHHFFADLLSWLDGSIGEGHGRRAVVQEPFTADFCSYPVLAEVALTYRCNLTCAFCYAGCGRAGLPDGWSEDRVMSDDEVCRVLEVIRLDARCPSVSFTGGEPTLRPSLPRFVRHAKGLGLKVNLISNGQLLDGERVDALAEAGLDSAQLSLEGPTRGAPRRDRRQAGGVREPLGGARAPASPRHPRPHEHDALPPQPGQGTGHRRPRGRPGPRATDHEPRDPVRQRGRAARSRDPLREIGDHVLRLRARAEARGIELVWYSPLPLCLFNTIAHGLGNRGCAAADGLLHVSPSGDVLPCSSFGHAESLGNLLREPFLPIWQSRGARFFRSKAMMPGGCESCPEAAACQGACVLYWREKGVAELGRDEASRPRLPEGFRSTAAARAD